MNQRSLKVLGEIKADLKELYGLNNERPVFYELQKEKALIETRTLFEYGLKDEFDFLGSRFNDFTQEECNKIENLLRDNNIENEMLKSFKSYMGDKKLDNETIKTILLEILEDIFLDVLGVDQEEYSYYKNTVTELLKTTSVVKEEVFRINDVYKELAYFKTCEV